jgi:hypothetical protein
MKAAAKHPHRRSGSIARCSAEDSERQIDPICATATSPGADLETVRNGGYPLAKYEHSVAMRPY